MIFTFYEQHKEKNKLKRLYKKYSNYLYKIAYCVLTDKSLVEDAIQETFAKLIKKADRINEDDEYKTAVYIGLYCKYTAMDMNGEQYKEIHMPQEFEHISDDTSENDPLDYVINKENISELEKAIKELPEIYSDSVKLFYYSGISCDEIAQIMKTSPANVRKRLERARKMLKEKLERSGYNER